MLTMPLLLTSFHRRYGRLPYEGVADSSYGSELPLHGGEQHTDLCQVQLLPHGAEALLQAGSPTRGEPPLQRRGRLLRLPDWPAHETSGHVAQ